MPIPEKIDLAKQKYKDKLKEIQALAAAEPLPTDFEKVAIGVLLEMLQLKTEAEILDRVVKHQSS